MPVDPNMGFTNPTPGSTVGPTYATNVSEALTDVGGHRHTGAPDGLKIQTAGLDIDGDLSFASHNVKDARTLRCTPQASTPNGVGDISCLYFKTDNNLWCNNGLGVAVQITSGSTLFPSAFRVFPRQAVAGNQTILAADTYVFLDVDTGAARTVTLPAASGVDAGRAYLVLDEDGTATTNPITVNRAGADTIDGATSYVVKQAFGGVMLISNGSNAWRALGMFDPRAGNLAFGTGPADQGALRLSHGDDGGLYFRNEGDDANLGGVRAGDEDGGPGAQVIVGSSNIKNADSSGAAFGEGSLSLFADEERVLFSDGATTTIKGATTLTVGASGSGETTEVVGDEVKVGVTGGKVGFLGTAPTVKGSVTGSRAGNAALASLLTYLAAKGILTDGTS